MEFTRWVALGRELDEVRYILVTNYLAVFRCMAKVGSSTTATA
jgi:hypothetical protein